MVKSVVATRYANALFKLGDEKGLAELHRIGDVLQDLKVSMEVSEQLSMVFNNPILPLEEKKNVLEALLKKFKAKETEHKFFLLLAEKERLPLIPAIAQHFSDLLDKKEGICRGTLTTALEIDAPHQSSIIQSLEKQTGRKLVLTFVVNPALLGGTMLQIGDMVYDASLATQLNNLSQTIKRGGGK